MLWTTVSRSGVAELLFVVPAVVALALELRYLHRPTTPLLHQYGWLVAAVLLLVPAAWTVVDLPELVRCVVLAAALVVLISVTTALFVQPLWYDPDQPTTTGPELARRFVPLVTAAASVAIVVSGRWSSDLVPAVWALGALPFITLSRIWNVDQSLRHCQSVIREEGQLGRDQILRDIHGALSTELRQLEQQAREFRLSSPALYELAVNASSSLRETLTLTDESRETSTTTDTLTAPVLTLTRAEGASASFRIRVDELHRSDREIARYVLNELVSDALLAGASRVDVEIVRDRQHIVVTVRDNGSPIPADDWKRPESGPEHLEQRLVDLSGSLTVLEPPERMSGQSEEQTRWTNAVVARWRFRG